MNTFELQLFLLLSMFFEDNLTNPFIRKIYSEGIIVTVEDYDKCCSRSYHLPPEKLTDSFLDDSRRLYKLITKEIATE